VNIAPRSKLFADIVTELLSRGHRVRFRADGVSMHPTIRAGETVTVEPVSKIGIGDIVFYRAERGLIAHRVVRIRKENGGAVFLTRGEARGSTDEAVLDQHVFGRVLAVERNGRSINLAGRWEKIRSLATSVLLLVSAFVAIFPSAARANVITTTKTTAINASGGNTCTLNFDAATLSPNLILLGFSFQNIGSIISVTTTSGNVTNLQPLFGITNTAKVAIYEVTGFSNTALTLTGNFNGANGFVCGAIGFAGVLSVGTLWTATSGTSTSASITGANPGPGGVIFDTLALGTTVTATPGASQVQEWQLTGTRPGAASVSTPATTMSWSWTGSSGWAEAAVPLNPTSTTGVQTTSFTVTQHADRNLIELTTGREVSSLGFNLYREQDGTRVRLNSSLLAGTALLAGSETSLTAGHVHTWWDAPSGDSRSASYWLEEVDLHGQHTWHGPATSKPARVPNENSGRAVMLSRVGRETAATHALQARATPTVNIAGNTSTQYTLAAGPAVKLGVQSEGWYKVAWSDLLAAGLDPGADPATLQLFAEGVEQPIALQAGANIQFYGTGLDTTWSDTRVYWLTWGSGSGRRVHAETQRLTAPAGPSNFPATVEWKPRTVYFAALLNKDADNFFGPVLTSGEPINQTIIVTHRDPSAAAGAQLQVTLQGVSISAHSVDVALNGSDVGTLTFSDQTESVATLVVPEAVLQEGANLLTLTVEGGDGDVSVVDSVELSYPHTYTADNDSLRFTALTGQTETVGGFSNAQILVVDSTNPGAVTLVPNKVTLQGGSYAVTIVPLGGGMRTLLALTTAQEAQPASITTHHPSSWHAPQPGFDMVMISHADFVESLGPLATLHQGEGRKVAVIDVNDLYDEFNFGEKSPYALKQFLMTAKAKWVLKPHFVLLVGDATYDPRNYLGVGNFDFVPTYLVDTALLETASDDWLADFTGQGIPQMAIGRLPVRTAEDAAAQVSKIVNYIKSGAAPWKQQVLLVAGQNDSEDNFEGNVAAVKALLPADLTVSEIVEGTGANAVLLNSLNVQGQAMLNYAGHGSEAIWAGGLFSSTDADGLTNGSMVPFVVSMTCLNGYFQDVYGTALAKALIEAPGGGALAVWASSGLTDSGPQAVMNQALIKALFGTRPMTLGEAAAKAKSAISDLDVRRTWILFGDPAVKLQ